MKMSNMLISTLREAPSEAEIESHKLMLRAGLIRKNASGVYNFMPLGLRALKKVEKIVREEMDKTGAQELLASALIPSELWKESGRWEIFGPEMFKLQDRNSREFLLGPTHEEVFTDIARNEIKSYRQLPLNLYQIQTKYRDERRPRFGVIRSREFIMKDAYSFDKDEQDLDKSYQLMYNAYKNVFKRCGVDCRAVAADSGSMGGSDSAEFMVNSEIGEDEIVFCENCSYAANQERAEAIPQALESSEMMPIEKVATPGARTIEELVKFFGTASFNFVKTLIYTVDGRNIAVLVRGDRSINETKVVNFFGGAVDFSLAAEDAVKEVTSAETGFAGPVDIKCSQILIDYEVSKMTNFIVGANETGYHYKNVNYSRDFTGILGDFRNVSEGDLCPKCGGKLNIKRGIEVGHIFKLGTKYSKALDATFVDEDGCVKPLVMGCYGIGINRTLAAVIEQHHDNNGIIWPLAVAPYTVVIIPAVMKNKEQTDISEALYKKLKDNGIEVVLDDRDERTGVKFKDADLMGFPIRITVGKKCGEGIVEFKLRKQDETVEVLLSDVLERVNREK